MQSMHENMRRPKIFAIGLGFIFLEGALAQQCFDQGKLLSVFNTKAAYII